MNKGTEWISDDYERGFIDGMSKQAHSSVDKALNAMIPYKREWVGLTDGEMLAAIRPMYRSEGIAQNALDLSKDEYRAIEAALKEKNT
jgi:hypothetical protein